MNIGILGSGDVAQVLGAGFVKLGHSVKLGTRNPQAERVQAWVKLAGPRASAGSFADAASFAEVAVLATLWTGTENAIRLAKPDNLAGKTVIDTTNPLLFTSEGLPPRLALGTTDSAGEQVQRWLPNAHVVKAFNHVGNANMVNPIFAGGPPDMFICGNSLQAKQTVIGFLKALGWGVIDLGGIDSSRWIEPLAMIWVVHGFRSGRWGHSFKLLHK